MPFVSELCKKVLLASEILLPFQFQYSKPPVHYFWMSIHALLLGSIFTNAVQHIHSMPCFFIEPCIFTQSIKMHNTYSL